MSESQIVAAFKSLGLETAQQREQILNQGIVPNFDYPEEPRIIMRTSTNSNHYSEERDKVAELQYAP